MVVRLTVRVDDAAVRAALAPFGPPHWAETLSIALNQTARQVKLVAAKQIAKAGGFKALTVRRSLRISMASPDTLTATIVASGRPMKLYKMGRVTQGKRGVTAPAWGQRKLYRGAFIARVAGHVGVFRRFGRARLPIKELWGPSIPKVMLQDEVKAAVEQVIPDRLKKNVLRQVDRRQRLLRGRVSGRGSL